MKNASRFDKALFLLYVSLALAGVAYGCLGCGGAQPLAVPVCGAASGVRACPGSPVRETLDGRRVAQVECEDSNSSMTCQVATPGGYALAACSHCGLPWALDDVRVTSSSQDLASDGVVLCSPLAYRGGSYCAVCDPASSMQFGYVPPPLGGYASDVVCVRSCDACAAVPQ